jgi:GNAT superfamily N-acetyltransferase
VNMKSVFEILQAKPEDVPIIMRFIRELAEYEHAIDLVQATEDDLNKALFGDSPKVWAAICWGNDVAIGFVLYFFNFSTWTGRHGLFLEDLYVSPQHRGSGAGKALLRHLAQVALKHDCARFEWNVLDWNKPAIEFYESLGALPQSEWLGYRLTGAALAALAESK